MKINKKQGLAILSIAAFIVTMMFSAVFVMPTRPAAAAEIIVPVSTEAALKEAVKKAETTPTTIKLEQDIELPVEWIDGWSTGLYIKRGQNITIDVNGHTLASRLEEYSGIVFYNMGTLSVIDSSEDYKGKVVSNGAISDQKWNADLMALIMNYGNLTLDVEFGLERPDSTEFGTPGYYTDVQNKAPSVLIRNEFILPNSVDDDVNHVSLTINGGTFDMNTIAGATAYGFFYIKDADLTINGGTFRNTSGRQPLYGGFLGKLESVNKRSSVEEKIVEDRHVEVTINNCDMRGDYFDDKFFNTSQYNTQKIPNEKYTIKIFGGIFPADFSAYTDVDHTMIEETVTANEGKDVIERYWVFTKADPTNAGAIIMKNGEPVKYCLTFDDAWTAANLMSENRAIVLMKDGITSQTLKINNVEADLTLDLNGHNLTVSPEVNFQSYHFMYDNKYIKSDDSYYGKFVVRDGSGDKDGELILNYRERAQYGGISLSKCYQFVLESGTIHITGVKPNVTPYYEPGIPLFHFSLNGSSSNSHLKPNAVLINGGNIVSDFAPDDVKVAVWEQDSSGNKDVENITNPDDAQKASFKIADPEFTSVLDDYLKVCGGMRFTWDLKNFIGQEFGETSSYKWVESKEGYIFLKAEEIANYYAANHTYATFADAIAAVANAEDKSISALTDVTEESGITIPNGVTLNLNKYLNYTLTGNVTLEGGASLLNGSVVGDVTVSGAATISNAKLKKTLTVEKAGSVSLYDGTYEGSITVKDGGNLIIYGGKFAEGMELETYDSYIYPGFGAMAPSGGYRMVKPGVASLAALKWYNQKGAATAGIQLLADGDIYQINSVEEWLYFSSIVNSNQDSFKDDTIELKSGLNFKDRIFLTAGICGAPFEGTFNGNKNTIINVDAQELTVGLFGKTGSGCVVNDLTIESSNFTAGSGYFDEDNQSLGYLAAGSVVGDGYLGMSSGIKIIRDTIDQEGNGKSFLGAVIGHTYSSVSLKDPEIEDSSVQLNWKSGGIVGYVEGGLTLNGGSISGLKFTGETGWYPGGVLAGDLNSANATITDATIDCPDLRLNGGSSSGVQVTVEGTKTDIHVDSLGTAGKFEFTLSADKTDSAQLQVGSELPSNATVKDNEGNDITQEKNPDGDGFIMQAAPKKVEVYYGNGEIRSSYNTIEEALKEAQSGDRIYLQDDVTESVTIETEKNVTINLYTHILTGDITVKGTLTLENGTVKGSVKNEGGELTFERGEKGLIIENTTEAVTGDYTVPEEYCVRKTMSNETLIKLELAAEHENTKYTAVGNVITVSCAYCDHEAGNITLTAENFTYDGNAHEAEVTVEPEGLLSIVPTITYKRSDIENGTYTSIEGLPTASGYYEASIQIGDAIASVRFSSLQMAVIVSDIMVGTVTYSDTAVEVTSFRLTTVDGKEISTKGFTLKVMLKESAYSVGKNVALITAITLAGAEAENYMLAPVGQQAFLEVTVVPATLYVVVNEKGRVSYEGFAYNEDEKVLGGELGFDIVDNGDGTSTVTPKGLESENYDIVYVGGVVSNSVLEPVGDNLWIVWVVIGAIVAVLGAMAIVFAVRKKRG